MDDVFYMQEVRSFRCGAYFLQVLERVVEDISFHAPERAGDTYTVDKEKVRQSVGDLLHKTDLSRFVL
jgi:ATP-dependent HslUV protease ATP-binding subunit HslU